MKILQNFTVRARLIMGFAIVICLLFLMVAIARYEFSVTRDVAMRVVERDLPKSQALYTLNSATRDNAQRTLEHFVWDDKAQLQKISEQMRINKRAVDESLETLERLIYTQEGKTLLETIRTQRKAYLASFTNVAALVSDGQTEKARALVVTETLPSLAALQRSVTNLYELQSRLIASSQSDVQANLDVVITMLLGLGIVATALAVVAAIAITRSVLQELGGEPSEAVRVASRIAAGDLTVQVHVSADDKTSLMHALREMHANLCGIVSGVRQGTTAIQVASQQIAAGNSDLAARTEEQASSLEETASSMEQISTTVHQGASNAANAHALSGQAAKVVKEGGQIVSQVVETMDDIHTSSQRIVEIISVIDDLAFQTNILALNAAVEAARAGEQGRGFAVVASEVRALAQRSATAAKEIKTLINDSVQKVELGTELVGRAGDKIEEVVGSIQRVATLMSEMNDATQQQNSGINQITHTIGAIDQATQQNATLVEELAAAASSMQQQASALADAVNVFQLPGTLTLNQDSPPQLPVANRMPALA